jgi:hypothetical protein
MRMLVNVRMPLEPFNTLVRQGKVGEVLGRIFDDIHPEAIYFSEEDGKRGVILIVDVKDASRVPSIAEPFFLQFNAECHFHVVMSPEDLMKAGLDELGRKWA